MLEYKVCFHVSYFCPWTADSVAKYVNKTGKSKAKRGHGKLHYCGRTLEEAVEKVRNKVAWWQTRSEADKDNPNFAEPTKITSMWIMRGRERGKNIKWDDYHKSGEPKRKWERELKRARIYYNIPEENL